MSGPGDRDRDRFIPTRGAMNFDLGHHHLVSKKGSPSKAPKGSAGADGNGSDRADSSRDTELDRDPEDCICRNAYCTCGSPSKQAYSRSAEEALFRPGTKSSKILTYTQKAPLPSMEHQNNLRVLYSGRSVSGANRTRKSNRIIPQAPDRILDAPELMDDYYLNLLDWNASNLLAVALGPSVYIWNAGTGAIQHLMDVENGGDDAYVSSVSWIQKGSYLAVGTDGGEVQLWDVEKQRMMRSMKGHTARVGAMSWNRHILSSGSRSGNIHHHDVRAREHHTATLTGHEQEICGLKWSPDGSMLASGANDNLLMLWDASTTAGRRDGEGTSARHVLSDHTAAVKALAWCPWNANTLASGGGTADRHIRFWNATNGTCLNSIDTKSQVCSLLWNTEHREIVSSHGFSQNQLCIWKYPSMAKVTELTGHTSRVLHMAISPDGQTVCSAAGDETLRFWKCFASEGKKEMGSINLGSMGQNASSGFRAGMIR
eukprot:Clim_evm21s77 gene=Clim_evmTU21s77